MSSTPNRSNGKIVEIPRELLMKCVKEAAERYGIPRGPPLPDVICPYSKGHRLPANDPRSVQNHIEKCRKRHENEKAQQGIGVLYVSCRFNRSHSIPQHEVVYHEKHCEDRFKLPPHIKKTLGFPVTEEEWKKWRGQVRTDVYDGCDNDTLEPIPKEAITNPKMYKLRMQLGAGKDEDLSAHMKKNEK